MKKTYNIDSLAKETELLQLYEKQKVKVLEEVFGNLRKIQMPTILNRFVGEEEIKDLLEEIKIFRHALRRIVAVIQEQTGKFDDERIQKKLAEELHLVAEMDRFALFYRNTSDLDHLSEAYNKIFQLVQSFKTVSNSINAIKLEKAA